MMRAKLTAAAVAVLAGLGAGLVSVACAAPARALPCEDCDPGGGGDGGLPPEEPATCQPNTSASGNPVIEVSNTHLGAAHYQNTTGTYDRASNTIAALTHTWDNNWFGGFHATPTVVLIDSCNHVVGGAAPGVAYGVVGTAEASMGFGPADRLDFWSSTATGPSSPQRAVRAIAIHKWAPENQVTNILTQINAVLSQAITLGQNVSTLLGIISAL